MERSDKKNLAREGHASDVESDEDRTHTIPVVEEELEIKEHRVETGSVRVQKVVHENEAIVDEPIVFEDVEIRRREVDEFVDEAVPIRQEGDTTIISTYEEVLVVEKRLKLKEEIQIIRRHTEKRDPQKITLRKEEAVVHRDDKFDKNQGDSLA
ncbi:MAG: YsnF/AvaK domain-containing protein [Bradymonadaceae bacterium]